MKKEFIRTALIISISLFFANFSQATDQSKASNTNDVLGEKVISEAVVADQGAAEETATKAVAAVVADGVTVEEASTETVSVDKIMVDVEDTKSRAFYDKYIKDHLQIGTKSVYRVLTDDDSGHKGGTYGSGTFLGTIYGLDEKQNIAPIEANISYFFNKYIGVQLSYDKIEAETKAIDSYTGSEKTDGSVSLSGPSVSLLVRFANSTSVTPYIGTGLDFYSASFDADSEWTLSSRYNGNAYNVMDVEDVTGWHFIAGADWLFAKNWAIDFTFQYTTADVDATYYGYYYDELYTTQEGHFPLDNISIGLGLAYHF